ncbi:MAG TPA: DUF885 domain-containing protein, partial [Sphingomicrobium sp.]|nr:DUF885 domain-containing protein [Sphingomicrobium sp.]
MNLRLLIVSASLLSLATAVAAQSPAWEPKVTPAAELTPAEAAKVQPPAQASAHDRLFELFKESDEASLERNPLQALYRGDMRFADRLGDLFSDAHYQGEKAAAEHDLAALHAIPRDQLSEVDKLAYDTFEWQTNDVLRNFSPGLLPVVEALPMNHFYGLQTSYPTLESGQGGAPFISVADYENGLKRNHDFVRNLDTAMAQWRKGEAEGIVDTKLTVRNMIEQINTQLALKPEDSPYWGPIKSFPKSISAADQARLTNEYRAAITGEIYPALTKLRDFLQNEYLPRARDGVGLMYMKGGDAYYRYLVQSNTTLPMTPDQVHQLGLSEVVRITKEFEKVQQQVGFKGTLQQFFDHMRTDKQFQPKSREQLRDDFYRIKKAVDAKVPQYFSLVPKTPLVIRPYPTFREKFEA